MTCTGNIPGMRRACPSGARRVWGLIFGQALEMGAVWLGFLAVQMLASWCAFRLDGERARVLWSVPLQQFVYRQLMYLVVIQSTVTALVGSRLRWRRVDRRGMGTPPGMPTLPPPPRRSAPRTGHI